MFSDALQRWTLTLAVISSSITLVNLQMPYPMFPMPAFPPMVAMPQPFPVGIPIPVPIGKPTTTTESPDDKRQDPRCPACSCRPCTPVQFSFCSPCHQLCRCKKSEDRKKFSRPKSPAISGAYPVPLSFPMPAASVVVVQYPPADKASPKCSESAASDSDSCQSGEEPACGRRMIRRQRKHRKSRRVNGQRSFRRNEVDTGKGYVKPFLSYVSDDGDVKINRRITDDEAAKLMNDDSRQTVHLTADKDSENKDMIVVTSNKGQTGKGNPNIGRQSSNLNPIQQISFKDGTSHHQIVKEGKKQLIFRPPHHKKISNLSVSFQVTK